MIAINFCTPHHPVAVEQLLEMIRQELNAFGPCVISVIPHEQLPTYTHRELMIDMAAGMGEDHDNPFEQRNNMVLDDDIELDF